MNSPMQSKSELKTYHVWDRTVRWFHWINVLCVLCLIAVGTLILYGKHFGVSGEGKILLKTIHVFVGYVLVLNLAWRLVWAFIGGPFARWKALLPFIPGSGGSLIAYMKAFRQNKAPAYAGHNPVARLSITILLVLLISQATTGLVLAGTDLFFPPLGGSIAQWVAAEGQSPGTLVAGSKEGINPEAWDEMRAFRKPYGNIHKYGYWALLVMILLHVGGAIVTEVREKNGIISAMFSGQKVFSEKPVDIDDRRG